MIVAVFVLFSLLRGLIQKRNPIARNNLSSPSVVDQDQDQEHRQAQLNESAVVEANLNSSLEELCVSLQSDTLYSSATSKIYDKRRQDSSSICSDIFNTDEGGRSVAEEAVRITTRKSLTRIRRCMSRTSLTRRRRTTGRYIGDSGSKCTRVGESDPVYIVMELLIFTVLSG